VQEFDPGRGNRRCRGTRRLFLLPAVLAWAVATSVAGVEVQRPLATGYVTLTRLTFGRAKRIAAPLLSERGKVRFIKPKRVLVIEDYPERVQQIERALREVDTAPLRLRLEVALRATSPASSAIRVLSVANFEPVCAWRRSSVSDHAWCRAYGVARGWWRDDDTPEFLSVGLWLQARLLSSGEIELVVCPRVDVFNRRASSFVFSALLVTVVAQDGETARFGRVEPAKQALYRRLFGDGALLTDGRLTLRVTPHVEKPAPSGAGGSE